MLIGQMENEEPQLGLMDQDENSQLVKKVGKTYEQSRVYWRGRWKASGNTWVCVRPVIVNTQKPRWSSDSHEFLSCHEWPVELATPRVNHGLSSKSQSARVACEPVVRIPMYYWLLSVLSSGGRGCLLLPPVGLLLPTGRPFPPTSGPVISRQWTYYLPQIGLFILRPTAHFSSIEPFIPLAGLLLPVASINNQFASTAEQNGSIPATKLLAIACLLGTSSKADTAHQKPNKGRKRKGQTGQQQRPKMRARPEANPAYHKPNKGRQRKGQTGQQQRPKMRARSKANPAHQKPNKGRQRKGQTGQQHRTKMWS
ncbi:hypothetical protein PHYBLDRAFT_178945 [Phycomyces blakesleeanus NRRL 1555(-)]|uniref:Uncharacterized protein n=1 Tax=Phycomyces blakesleeanus (strain ATCC 8743b / DSM 1359 / FGSC 10004 / NBRC 33097 / NRRL 1555) TaxID=763407 RepID=A0A167RER4_PHYB8|nr:hypothetical protein PHYBLDRAFT_178945 [Phycomyces blakesleeanus NRRL 1555(-)]OAD81479.1 hypothetical protein PHYBLDRAFT_178945 [Phycomyces blakesleeanus NRRL 1555(-)]|eukprot:XP_018299519.1 hypothetical protein PHYBLDRAFT_178945 [Phycomyces blakesleeanus NRRL 1555(-)]